MRQKFYSAQFSLTVSYQKLDSDEDEIVVEELVLQATPFTKGKV